MVVAWRLGWRAIVCTLGALIGDVALSGVAQKCVCAGRGIVVWDTGGRFGAWETTG
ncbi:hypothetical protein Adi01nite_80610 [Amorphoplanes digitatis]|nr:hypothetical protein Adi01nite_80610 [Actinoplanes digitatis]